MRRFAVLFALCLSLPAAGQEAATGDHRLCADTQAGAAALPAAPYTLKLKLHVGWEHGCSQSMERFGEVGTLTLAVDGAGAATLELDLFHAHTFGPSFGRYKQGDHEFTHQDSRLRARWKGKAVKRGAALVATFTSQESTAQLWGGGDWKPEKSGPASLEVVCEPASVRLDPPLGSGVDGGPAPAPACAPVLLCGTSQPILSFEHERVRERSRRLFIQGSLPLALAPGLEATLEEHYSSEWDYLRAAKE
ncbi:MAG TPA: hypothetical protein PK668_12885 [Myxococcota bacterium]|nr:hypothetical protein [Myxococcota bacterium]HRY93634.1 hypothetical protein [Myxococcota bacterium]HSA23346.1 hypothetical protein [Myxococcota bacterium]